MSWNAMKKAKEESGGGGGLFVKLKDGDEVEGVFMGEPHTFYQVFGSKTEHDNWVDGSSFKFKIPFVVKENGVYVAKIFQGSKTTAGILLDVKDEYGTDCLYKIKRKGSTKEDTKYSILFKGNLSVAELESVKKIELPSLKPKTDGSSSQYDERNPPPGDY